MADLLQVAAPVTPKNYNFTTRPIVQNDEIFDLVDLSKIIKTADRTEQFSQQEQTFEENAIPTLPMLIAKDPALTANSLKSLLSSDVLNMIAESGNTELLNKLNELAGEVILNPSDLLSDMKSQQQSSTIFTGDFFNILRGVSSQTTNPDIKAAIVNLLKATVNASSGKQILNSISANLKYLADQLSPSRALSLNLQSLSEQLKDPNASQNFTAIRNQILSVLNDVNSSLLLTDKMRNLLPLITHNLSRYNDNPTAMKDCLTALTAMLTNKDLKAVLLKTFEDFVDNSGLSQDVKLQSLNPDDTLAEKLATEAFMQKITCDLANQAKYATQSIDANVLTENLSTISAENGINSLREMLMQILPDSSGETLDKMLNDFYQTKDLNALLDKLSEILNSIDSMDVKVAVAESLNKALGQLAKSENINYTPPSSMESLVNFLSKNISDAALRSLNAFNQNEMVQSLLTAPGVFTPLLHYLVPVKFEDTRAFGELWIDNDAGGKNSYEGDNQNHLFLSFSIESIGDFELEIFTKSQEISIALMCPENFTKKFSSIKDNIAKIAVHNGYSIANTTIDTLKEKRNLLEVFPRIIEKRAGLNVAV